MSNPGNETVPDNSLLRRAQSGDAEAFGEWIQPFENRLFHQALALCRHEADADDLVQQTLLEAWKSLSRFNHKCRFSTWLYAILLHRHHKLLRSARVRSFFNTFSFDDENRAALMEIPDPNLGPDAQIEETDVAQQCRSRVNALPPKLRAVILLRFFEEASLDEIADVLHCSIGTVKSRLHHALKQLRKMKDFSAARDSTPAPIILKKMNFFQSGRDKETKT